MFLKIKGKHKKIIIKLNMSYQKSSKYNILFKLHVFFLKFFIKLINFKQTIYKLLILKFINF